MVTKNAITDDFETQLYKNAYKGTEDQVTGTPPQKFLVQLDMSLSWLSNVEDVNRSC